jgi:predicted Fe-S protein YdhL (DUF1289 family)
MNALSPCIRICQLDDRQICLGCFRSRAEIVRWMQMTAAERLAVVASLDERRRDFDTDRPAQLNVTAP